MSRIDEALRQAGRKTPADAAVEQGASLADFPTTSPGSDAFAAAPPAAVAIQKPDVRRAVVSAPAERLITH
jgi:hypothetical protein